MNMKKIMAGVVASAMAVGTMAVAANAGAITTKIPDAFDDGSGNFQIFLRGDGAVTGEFENVDFTKIASFDITFSWDDSDPDVWTGGAIILQSDAKSWNDLGQWSNDDGTGDPRKWANVESGKPIRVELPEAFAADSTYVIITVQNYGPDINIDSLVLYDASGATLYPAAPGGDETPGEDETPSGDETPGEDETPSGGTGSTDTPSGGDNKPVPDSGIEGVAVVAGLAIVAAGAVVVAKKRK